MKIMIRKRSKRTIQIKRITKHDDLKHEFKPTFDPVIVSIQAPLQH